MVCLLVLAALAAQTVLPPGTQPRKLFSMTFPRNVISGPRQVILLQPPKQDICSVPLTNAFNGERAAVDSHMPSIKPGVNGTMRLVDPPAPPCKIGPPK